jgi:hypothetical protein
MTELFRSSAWVPGIWLLERKDLEELDGILDEQWKRLDERRKADIKNKTDKALRELEEGPPIRESVRDGA